MKHELQIEAHGIIFLLVKCALLGCAGSFQASPAATETISIKMIIITKAKITIKVVVVFVSYITVGTVGDEQIKPQAI